MFKTYVSLVLAIHFLAAFSALAQEGAGKSVEGTFMLNKRSYLLKHALAYETTSDTEEGIAVVLSGQTVSSERLAEARDAAKDGNEGSFDPPYLQLLFKKTGELRYWGAAASGTSLGRHTGKATGAVKVQDGRVTGKATQPLEADSMFPSSFDVSFNTALVKRGESLPVSPTKRGGPAAKVKPTVSGVFTGNGKEGKLTYVSAHWGEPFGGKPGIVLVLTEKDQGKEKKPETAAMFGKLGSALIVSLHEDGRIYGCQVVHSAHVKQGFSSIGNLEANDFEYADGKVEGEFTTNGQVDTFGEKWEVKLNFVAPLGELQKEFQASGSDKPQNRAITAKIKAIDEDDHTEPQPSGPKL